MQSMMDTSSAVSSPCGMDSLADIRDVVIDPALSAEERMKSYLRQIRNPYHYKCGDMTVRVSFAQTDATLEDRIRQYLLSSRVS